MNSANAPKSRIAKHVLDIPRSGIRDFFDIVSTMKEVISLGVGEPDFDTPLHIREAAMAGLQRGETGYTSNMGMQELRDALSGYVARTFDVRYRPEDEILITTGVSEGLDLALRAMVEPGDEVLYHEPCYVSNRPVIIFAHATPIAIETRGEDNFRLTRRDLEQKVTPRTRALILNYPNNPTGAILDRADLQDIADFAQEHDLIVITDEIYAELTYDAKHVSIASLPGMKERTIFLHGFSKAWSMTGFRLGYACGPAELIEAMMKVHQYTMLCAPTLAQVAAIEALRDPENDIAGMRNEYKRRRDFIHHSFQEMGIPCPKPLGAFYAFPDIRQFGLSSKEFATRFLAEEKVAVVPGPAFGACGEGSLRCAYATALDQIEVAMSRLKRFTGRLQKSRASAASR